MNEKLIAFKESIRNKRVAVIGLGVSNMPLTEYLGRLGVSITVFDKNEEDALKDKIEALKAYNIDFSLGSDYLSKLKGYDIIFRTPVIRPDIPELLEEEKNGALITSEMETFIDLCPAEIFGITGSDGKTTTATITYNLLKEAGFNCYLGGNIGTPLLNRIDDIKPDDKIVLELSSFQLFTVKKSPHTAVITNISPNHLDVHKSMDEYVGAKKNIYRHQSISDVLVLNYDNEISRNLSKDAPGTVVFFSRKSEFENGAFLKDNILCYSENGKTDEIMDKNEISLPGDHNVENYLAAICATWPYISRDILKKVAGSLRGIEHRIEFVRELNGVRYYNDSIGSSPSRTIATLNAFNQRVVLIAGGYDKQLSYDSMGDTLVEKVKHLILIGQTASKIETSLMRRLVGKYRGIDIRITRCATLRQAVDCASLSAKAGDIVLLSPASASFDMFRDFEERGRVFKEYVNNL